MVPVNVELTIAGRRLRATIPVPPDPVDPTRLLPVLQSLADTMVDHSVRAAAERGRPLSCKAGCGACCKQLVPVSRIEARRIAEVVESMPEPRRSIVRRRFADAIDTIRSAEMLKRLRDVKATDITELSSARRAVFPPRNSLPVPRERRVLDLRRPSAHLPAVHRQQRSSPLHRPDREESAAHQRPRKTRRRCGAVGSSIECARSGRRWRRRAVGSAGAGAGMVGNASRGPANAHRSAADAGDDGGLDVWRRAVRPQRSRIRKPRGRR